MVDEITDHVDALASSASRKRQASQIVGRDRLTWQCTPAAPVQFAIASSRISASKSAALDQRRTPKTRQRPPHGQRDAIAIFDGERLIGELEIVGRGNVPASAIRAGRRIPLGIFRSRAAARQAVFAVSARRGDADG